MVMIAYAGVAYAGVAYPKFGNAGPKKLSDVTVSEWVTVDFDGKNIQLKNATSGLRQKQILFAWPSVYAAQIFTNGKVDQSSVEALRDSLLSHLPVVVSMTFVRDVDFKKIVDGFTEVLKENNVDVKAAPYVTFLGAVQSAGDLKNGQTLWFVFNQSKDGEQFSFQANDRELFVVNNGKVGTLKNFFSMWLGKPVDSGLTKLQQQLLQVK